MKKHILLSLLLVIGHVSRGGGGNTHQLCNIGEDLLVPNANEALLAHVTLLEKLNDNNEVNPKDIPNLLIVYQQRFFFLQLQRVDLGTRFLDCLRYSLYSPLHLGFSMLSYVIC